MVKKLTQHGNSLALVLDKPILELLKISKDTPLEISTDGKNIVITPAQNIARRKKFEAAFDKINKRHKNTFKALAR